MSMQHSRANVATYAPRAWKVLRPLTQPRDQFSFALRASHKGARPQLDWFNAGLVARSYSKGLHTDKKKLSTCNSQVYMHTKDPFRESQPFFSCWKRQRAQSAWNSWWADRCWASVSAPQSESAVPDLRFHHFFSGRMAGRGSLVVFFTPAFCLADCCFCGLVFTPSLAEGLENNLCRLPRLLNSPGMSWAQKKSPAEATDAQRS